MVSRLAVSPDASPTLNLYEWLNICTSVMFSLASVPSPPFLSPPDHDVLASSLEPTSSSLVLCSLNL